jgi:pyridoxamine 5'-phosphate oxidase
MGSAKFESLTSKVHLDFPEYSDPPADPMGLVQSWFAAAAEHGVREPRAMAFATATAAGHASTRIIVLGDITDAGLVFTSHRTSQKGRELDETGWASGLFYWRETGQQLSVSGPVVQLGDEHSDALWRARPVPLHSMTTASRQSDPLDDPDSLRRAAQRLAEAGALPRPDQFVGYRLEPSIVEFWSPRPDRMHYRLRYDHDGTRWRTTRLQP